LCWNIAGAAYLLKNVKIGCFIPSKEIYRTICDPGEKKVEEEDNSGK
jgi:hypothetical protein